MKNHGTKSQMLNDFSLVDKNQVQPTRPFRHNIRVEPESNRKRLFFFTIIEEIAREWTQSFLLSSSYLSVAMQSSSYQNTYKMEKFCKHIILDVLDANSCINLERDGTGTSISYGDNTISGDGGEQARASRHFYYNYPLCLC